jgi:hypothetical protein
LTYFWQRGEPFSRLREKVVAEGDRKRANMARTDCQNKKAARGASARRALLKSLIQRNFCTEEIDNKARRGRRQS